MSTATSKRQTSSTRTPDDAGVMSHYALVIERDPRSDVYVVTVPDLEGCVTHGRTYEEAVAQAQDAIWSWLDAARAWGTPIPAPRAYPAISGPLAAGAPHNCADGMQTPESPAVAEA